MHIGDLDVETIDSAFSPAREIQDPQLFVGRSREIERGITALRNPGGFLAVFGLRGVGKSSVAYQLKLIAEGNNELPKLLELEWLLPRRPFNFLVHYVRVDRSIRTIADLFKRILFGDDSNSSLFALTKAGERHLAEFKRTVGIEGEAGFFGVKVGGRGVEESRYSPYVSDDVTQQFRKLLGTIRRDNQDRTGLLILIDEFDTIVDKAGFSSIVKACSSDFVRFGIVGIGSSIGELVRDHESVGRQIDFIHVPTMPLEELAQILRRAESRVNKLITFQDDVRELIALRSEGYPYFTHLLGKEAMLMAFYRLSAHISQVDIETLAKRIVQGRLGTIYEDLYHAAVKSSAQREVLLKAFAEVATDAIATDGVYSLVRELGISNPSQLMQELTGGNSSSPVLVKVRDRYYRFTDPVFKVYARIRNWKL